MKTEKKKKRCCNNCIDLIEFERRGEDDATLVSGVECRQDNLGEGEGVFDTKKLVCDSHRYYGEVFKKG